MEQNYSVQEIKIAPTSEIKIALGGTNLQVQGAKF
jgi:hypothetical protein